MTAAASLTAMQYVAVAAFAAFTAAAAAGAAELEKFEQIAKKAAAADVGTTFFRPSQKVRSACVSRRRNWRAISPPSSARA